MCCRCTLTHVHNLHLCCSTPSDRCCTAPSAIRGCFCSCTILRSCGPTSLSKTQMQRLCGSLTAAQRNCLAGARAYLLQRPFGEGLHCKDVVRGCYSVRWSTQQLRSCSWLFKCDGQPAELCQLMRVRWTPQEVPAGCC